MGCAENCLQLFHLLDLMSFQILFFQICYICLYRKMEEEFEAERKKEEQREAERLAERQKIQEQQLKERQEKVVIIYIFYLKILRNWLKQFY